MKRAVIHRLLKEQITDIWGAGHVALVDANYADAIVDHMPAPGQVPGKAALKQVVEAFRTAIPDLKMTLHKTLAAGDYGVDVWTLGGTQTGPYLCAPASGKPVHFSGIDMVRVTNSQISEMWHVEEMAQFALQTGTMAAGFGAPTDEAAVLPPTSDADYDPGRGAIVPGEAAFDARERRNLAIARRHIEEIWAKGRSELCWEMYHPDAVDHNPAPGQRPGIPGIIDVLGWLREAVPDIRMAIQCYVIDGDWIADRWVMTGTHTGAPLMDIPARGKAFRINGMDVAHLDDDGRITDIWHCEEFASLVAQISN
jgi:predicted ester cyclase